MPRRARPATRPDNNVQTTAKTRQKPACKSRLPDKIPIPSNQSQCRRKISRRSSPLAEHASGEERREIFRRHWLWLLGIGILSGYLDLHAGFCLVFAVVCTLLSGRVAGLARRGIGVGDYGPYPGAANN